MNYKSEKVNKLIEQRCLLDAFEKYYYHEIVKREKEQIPVLNKIAKWIRKINFVQGLDGFKANLLNIAQNIIYAFSERLYNFENKDCSAKPYYLVSLPDGEIIRKKLYYPNNKRRL